MNSSKVAKAEPKQMSEEKIDMLTQVVDSYSSHEHPVEYRFFSISKGPIMAAFKKRVEENKKVRKAQRKLAEDLGAYKDVLRYGRGGLAFLFAELSNKPIGFKVFNWKGKPYQQVIDGVTYSGWIPDLTTAGKKISQRIEDEFLLPAEPIDDALHEMGMPPANGIPLLIENNKSHSVTAIYLSQIDKLVVRIPWRECPVGVIKAYKKLQKAGVMGSVSLNHLSWKPSKHMKELRQSGYWLLVEKHNDLVDQERKRQNKKERAAARQREKRAAAKASAVRMELPKATEAVVAVASV